MLLRPLLRKKSKVEEKQDVERFGGTFCEEVDRIIFVLNDVLRLYESPYLCCRRYPYLTVNADYIWIKTSTCDVWVGCSSSTVSNMWLSPVTALFVEAHPPRQHLVQLSSLS